MSKCHETLYEGDSERTLRGCHGWASREKEAFLKVCDSSQRYFCLVMLSRIPLYFLDANDPYNTAALASSRYTDLLF